MSNNGNVSGGVIANVDRKGVCENCMSVAAVVSHGHTALDGGPVSWDAEQVRCELTWPEDSDE